MCSRKVFYSAVSPAACAAMLTTLSLGEVWPPSPPGSLSNGCPLPRHSRQPQPSATLPVWLSRPLRNRCPLFFYNCSLISCPYNGPTVLKCSWSCCRYEKIKFCAQLCFPMSDFCCILQLEKKSILMFFACFITTSNRQRPFWNDFIGLKHAKLAYLTAWQCVHVPANTRKMH